MLKFYAPLLSSAPLSLTNGALYKLYLCGSHILLKSEKNKGTQTYIKELYQGPKLKLIDLNGISCLNLQNKSLNLN